MMEGSGASSPQVDHSAHAHDVGPAGSTYDLRWIDAMVQHHTGALRMSEFVFDIGVPGVGSLGKEIWRDQARAFAGDPRAQALTLWALEAGWIAAEPAPERRPFWLMPLMHSEDLALQERGLPLFASLTDARTADFARRHHAVIARFGRFPHRNQALGRPSSAEELAFLQQPGSRF